MQRGTWQRSKTCDNKFESRIHTKVETSLTESKKLSKWLEETSHEMSFHEKWLQGSRHKFIILLLQFKEGVRDMLGDLSPCVAMLINGFG